MIDAATIGALSRGRWSEHFVRPLCGSYCFAHTRVRIERLLIGESSEPTLLGDVLGDFPIRYERVVVLFVDSFDWCLLERYYERLSAGCQIVEQ